MKILTYLEAIIYLEKFIRPAIFRSITPEEAEKLDPLSRMRRLLELLGSPHKKFKSIQITGTSGKGSTSYFLANILSESGFKTGLTVSPHIVNANERLQISNNEERITCQRRGSPKAANYGLMPINDEEFIEILNLTVPAIEKLKKTELGEPTYYEILLAMAFLYFAKEKIDIAVVEVGLEGKYDGTNVLNPQLVVLTNIGLDHTEILGNTVEKIVNEAVFAIKPGCLVVSGAKQNSVLEIIKRRVKQTKSKLCILGKDFKFKILNESERGVEFDHYNGKKSLRLKTSLPGDFQAENASLAVFAALKLYPEIGSDPIKKAIKNTFVPGRFEIINFRRGPVAGFPPPRARSEFFSKNEMRAVGGPSIRATPLSNGKSSFKVISKKPAVRSYAIILDGAHNPTKMKTFLSALRKYFPGQKKIFLVAFKKDKEIGKMLKLIQREADKIIVSEFGAITDMSKKATEKISNIKNQILKINKNKNIKFIFEKDSRKALDIALNLTSITNNSIVVVTGSLYFVGEVRGLLKF